MSFYGKEIILDIHDCDTSFTRATIENFMVVLCDAIGMERADLHFWDYEDEDEKNAAPDHLAGTSAVQFITTSNVTIHTLDRLRSVYLNIFTCGDLNFEQTARFCAEYWRGDIVKSALLERA